MTPAHRDSPVIENAYNDPAGRRSSGEARKGLEKGHRSCVPNLSAARYSVSVDQGCDISREISDDPIHYKDPRRGPIRHDVRPIASAGVFPVV